MSESRLLTHLVVFIGKIDLDNTSNSPIMREHPIPQDITNYRFHIIGNMTLKQFGLLALGCMLALLVYSTNLFAVIKWPLIVIFVGMGVIAAFVPIAERPLDHWVFTFFRKLYSPTLFYWRREEHIPLAFVFVQRSDVQTYEPEIDLGPARRERIIEYMRSINNNYLTNDEYTADELARLQAINLQFGSVTLSANLQNSSQGNSHKPSLGVKVRKLNPEIGDRVLHITDIVEDVVSTNIPKEDVASKYNQHKSMLSADQVAQKIVIPEQQTIKGDSTVVDEEDAIIINQSENSDQFFVESAKPETITATQTTHFNTSLPFPTKPNEPNKLVGMVLSQTNDLITDAIVEIQTSDGHIVRAVKTNALGQFFVTTPLKNGDYILHVEKNDLVFTSQNMKLSGKIVEPIEVRSTT